MFQVSVLCLSTAPTHSMAISGDSDGPTLRSNNEAALPSSCRVTGLASTACKISLAHSSSSRLRLGAAFLDIFDYSARMSLRKVIATL
jgi:hypothetical protein